MPLNKNSYTVLLDALDIIRLRNVLEQLKESQEPIEPILSPLKISNLAEVHPIYRLSLIHI